MLLSELFEARKNADVNAKRSINSYIASTAKTKAQIAGTTNMFVSFTAIDKLGINPGSEYDTPLGIYAYPIDYLAYEVGQSGTVKSIPFAGTEQFANFFSARGNIVNLVTMREVVAKGYYQKIVDYVEGVGADVGRVKKAIKNAFIEANVPDAVGGQFWYVTMEAAEAIAEHRGGSVPVVWNKLFRSIGIDGVVDAGDDIDGMGIIHSNEPTSAVFFSIAAISDVKRVVNAYGPKEVGKAVAKGAERKAQADYVYAQLNKASDADDLYDLLVNDLGVMWFKLVRDGEMRRELLAAHPELIAELVNARASDQYVALKADFDQIRNIAKVDQRVVAKVFAEAPSDDKLRLIFNYVIEGQGIGNNVVDQQLQKVIAAYQPKMVLEFDPTYRSVVQVAVDNWALPVIPSWLKALAAKFGVEA